MTLALLPRFRRNQPARPALYGARGQRRPPPVPRSVEKTAAPRRSVHDPSVDTTRPHTQRLGSDHPWLIVCAHLLAERDASGHRSISGEHHLPFTSVGYFWVALVPQLCLPFLPRARSPVPSAVAACEHRAARRRGRAHATRAEPGMASHLKRLN
ncbi:hypothetical protein SETIT_7G196600v2 [Setaria italica]|uniref:Uncharacterized protein n=1 Tax=Setaria italica TaxID=4555 RepID=A0A368RXN3_SETIT|nr:hypothetical protein SETIT_7G196600v2 [Setaria italica]